MSSLVDWQAAGVSIKVELATSGDLVLSPTTYRMDFATGGENGAPIGWTAYVYNGLDSISNYNFTTANAVTSTSSKTAANYRTAGYLSPNLPYVLGATYQLVIRGRIMETYPSNTYHNAELQRHSVSTGNWGYWTGVSGNTGNYEWEDISTTSSILTASHDAVRISLLSGLPVGVTSQLYGYQWRDCVVNIFPDMTLPDPTWKDITCDVRSLTVKHGRERYTNRYEVASFQLQLNNAEGWYLYHQNHPFGLRPGRQVRVIATYNGVTYPMAYGVLDTIGQSYDIDGTTLANFSCLDVTSILGNTNTSAGGSNGQWGYQRIKSILDQAAFPSNKRKLDGSTALAFHFQQIQSSGRSLRDTAGVTADSDGGSIFADREGFIVWKNREWAANDSKLTTVQADLVAMLHSGFGPMPNPDLVPTVPNPPLLATSDLQTDWSMDRVINIVTLANRVNTYGTGTSRTFSDAESVREHGPQTYQRLDFELTNDYYLETRANDLMTNYTDPVLRVNRLEFKPGLQKQPDICWPFVLSVFLNWLVRVWYEQPTEGWGFTVCTHIQSVQHRITPTDWSTILVVDVPQNFQEIVKSDAGWDQGLWDVNLWDEVPGDVAAKEGAYWNSGMNWNGDNSTWVGRSKWDGISKWSNPPDDWKT